MSTHHFSFLPVRKSYLLLDSQPSSCDVDFFHSYPDSILPRLPVPSWEKGSLGGCLQGPVYRWAGTCSLACHAWPLSVCGA